MKVELAQWQSFHSFQWMILNHLEKAAQEEQKGEPNLFHRQYGEEEIVADV